MMNEQQESPSDAASSNTNDNGDDADERDFPFIRDAGIDLDVLKLHDTLSVDITSDQRRAAIASLLPRLPDSTDISNGLIRDFLKLFDSLPKRDTYDVLADFLPSCYHYLTPADIKRKVTTFIKTNIKKRKAKSKYNTFLQTEFDLGVRHYETTITPRKRALIDENKSLVGSKRKLATNISVLESQLLDSNAELKKAEQSIEVYEDAVEVMGNDLSGYRQREDTLRTRLNDVECVASEERSSRVSLQRKLSGMKSGEIRRKNKCVTPTPSSSTITSPPIKKAVDSHQDIVVVSDRLDDHTFQGKRYLGVHGRKTTTGHTNTYFEFDSNRKPCSALKKRELRKRSQTFDSFAERYAGGTDEDKELMYVQLLRSNKELFNRVLQKAGYSVQRRMLPLQGLQIQSLLRLSTSCFRNLRRALQNIGIDVMSSERGMIKEKVDRVSHVSAENVESGTMGLHKTAKDEKVVPCAFVSVKCLNDFLKHTIDKEPVGFHHDKRFNGKWWVLFSGDKGGNHMKFHLEVVNSLNNKSVDNVHLYCLFEASDTAINMRKVWNPYRSQVKKLMEPGFMINGREVEIFLGGDFHFLDDMLGHQGSSASYPCNVDYVPLSHLRNHGGFAHTPENCKDDVPLRTIKEYQDYYNANLALSGEETAMRDGGKNFYSIVEPMIFPMHKLENMVPASLHIMLGITLNLYNILLEVCREIDGVPEHDRRGDEPTKNEEYEIASLEYDNATQNLHQHGIDIITMENRIHRFHVTKDGNREENITTAKMGYKGKRDRNKDFEECNVGAECQENWCIMTEFDLDDLMVLCDKCEEWYHTMCDAVLPSLETDMNNPEVSYICAQCQHVAENGDGPVNRDLLFEKRISELLAEQEQLNNAVVDARRVADDKKAAYNEEAGERELALEAALEGMSVERQAYHGNVFVGNHCHIVLRRYSELTSVINDHKMYDDFNRVFQIFGAGVRLMCASRFLSDSEVEKLCSSCSLFGAEFPVRFPDRSLTRKMHEYIFNVPRFVKRWRTLGLLSEQEGESKHGAVKAELRSLCSVRSHKERIRLAMEREELRSSFNKDIVQPKPRKCQKCKKFLRAGTDKQKHCVICEPAFFKN